MKWHRDDDDYFMHKIPKQRAQQQLASFAIHLSMGNNLYGRRIALGTIKEYVNSVSKLTGLIRGVDVRKDGPTDQRMGGYLSAVYAELKRWENVPNRREPLTPAMLQKAVALAKLEPVDSLTAVLADWFVVGIFAGLRSGEYAQTESSRRNPSHPALNHRRETRAFVLYDIRAVTRSGRRLRGAAVASVPVSELLSVWLLFRTQKNGHHGAERQFAHDISAQFGFVQAIYRILQRFLRLRGADDKTTPLSMYQRQDGSVALLTSDDIAKHMRTIACDLYGFDPVKDKKEVNRWSAHPLRVGACVFLHASGFSALDIKWILRWESDAYRVYLRNFIGLSKKQNAAFAALQDTDPTVAMPSDFGFANPAAAVA